MTPLPRARCPLCGRHVALRVLGRLREHLIEPLGDKCPGSGLTVYAAREELHRRSQEALDRVQGWPR